MPLGLQWLNWLDNFLFTSKKGAFPSPGHHKALTIFIKQETAKQRDQRKASVEVISLPFAIVFRFLKMDFLFIHSGLQCETLPTFGETLHTCQQGEDWSKVRRKLTICLPSTHTSFCFFVVGDDLGNRVWCTQHFRRLSWRTRITKLKMLN